MKAVFLDTNVFYDIKFNLDDPKMNEFLGLTQKLGIECWITPITIEEIKSGINRKINDLKNVYKKAESIVKIFNDDKGLLNLAHLETIRRDALEQIDLFITQSGFKTIKYTELDDGDISKVFSDYFEQNGAFTPKARSKSKTSKEFPDAFQIELIRATAKCGDKIAIVSTDMDFSEALGKDNYLIRFPSLSSLNKLLKKSPPENNDYLSSLEHEIYFILDICLTFEEVFSKVSLVKTHLLEDDVEAALISLQDKGFLRLTDYNHEPISSDLKNDDIRKGYVNSCI
jgi:predicted nucleic acid-binding protein